MSNFRDIRNSTRFDAIEPPKADPKRVGLVAAGNPDVLREAAGQEDYARKRKKRGGRVKLDGVRPRHRLDRPSRGRKFADGGTADEQSDASAQTTASAGDIPRTGYDAWTSIPKLRAISDGLNAVQNFKRALDDEFRVRPAYRKGGGARR
jgi:hypothetical protein